VFVFATNRPHRFTHLRALMRAWDAMETILATEPAPFMYGLDAKGRLRRYVGPETLIRLVDARSRSSQSTRRRLGHSQIALTANTYGHISQSVDQEAADRMDALLGS
jgi:hypothetical protein